MTSRHTRAHGPFGPLRTGLTVARVEPLLGDQDVVHHREVETGECAGQAGQQRAARDEPVVVEAGQVPRAGDQQHRRADPDRAGDGCSGRDRPRGGRRRRGHGVGSDQHQRDPRGDTQGPCEEAGGPSVVGLDQRGEHGRGDPARRRGQQRRGRSRGRRSLRAWTRPIRPLLRTARSPRPPVPVADAARQRGPRASRAATNPRRATPGPDPRHARPPTSPRSWP